MKARNDRVVLITGASSGIGKACADHLAKGGYRVYGTSRKPPSAAPFRMLQLDVTDDESVEGTVNELLKREGRIDVLVNNAGIAMAGAIEDTSMEEARTQLETNFFGAFRMCRVVVPTMRAQKYGYIVTISSIGGQIAIPFQGLYSASKFALEGLSESLRMEVRPFGIKVILIQPGDHRTALTQNRQRVKGAIKDGSPYGAHVDNALARMAADEQNGPSPEGVARLLERIINTPHPRLRYSIGPLPERLALLLKRMAPYGVLQFGLKRYYGL